MPSGLWLDSGVPWPCLCSRLRARAGKAAGADHPKPQREPQKVTPPSASHMALQLRFPLKMTLKDLPARGLSSPCSLKREKMIPLLPQKLGRRTYKTDSFRNDNSQARGRLASGPICSPRASEIVYVSLLFNRGAGADSVGGIQVQTKGKIKE